MGAARGAVAEPAHGRLRARRVAGGRGVSDQRSLPLRTVTLYLAQGCHLCERVRDELEALRAELGFDVEEVDIGGRPELERAYRRLIPVVELDGERLSVYRLDAATLRARLAGAGPIPGASASQTPGPPASL